LQLTFATMLAEFRIIWDLRPTLDAIHIYIFLFLVTANFSLADN